MNHELKIQYEHYMRVKAGTKTFEIRVNDRAYQKGDTVTLRAFDAKAGKYFTHHKEDNSPIITLKYSIGDVYPIDENRVVFSLLKPAGGGK